jgi:hypothetical protein
LFLIISYETSFLSIKKQIITARFASIIGEIAFYYTVLVKRKCTCTFF